MVNLTLATREELLGLLMLERQRVQDYKTSIIRIRCLSRYRVEDKWMMNAEPIDDIIEPLIEEERRPTLMTQLRASVSFERERHV